jgi:hypothetical protein
LRNINCQTLFKGTSIVTKSQLEPQHHSNTISANKEGLKHNNQHNNATNKENITGDTMKSSDSYGLYNKEPVNLGKAAPVGKNEFVVPN